LRSIENLTGGTAADILTVMPTPMSSKGASATIPSMAGLASHAGL
jgi:hypothetical protein